MTKVLVPLADGVEEMEAVIIIDTLRRAEWTVVSARIPGPAEAPILASRGVRLLADLDWGSLVASDFDLLVIPGGAEGVKNLCDCETLLSAVREFHGCGKLLGAICAGPLVLQAAGVIDGRSVTSHPAVRGDLESCQPCDDRVAVDGHIVTSQGPGTAIEFALKLVDMVDGPKRAQAVAGPMVTG